MSLETPDRIHASAVCFWERTAIGPPTDRWAVGFSARNNFSVIATADDDTPDAIRLTMVRPIGKAQAVPLLTADVLTRTTFAGVSIGPPLTPAGRAFVDETPPDALVIFELDPPPRLVGVVGNIGDRANFFVVVLELPITEEGGA